MSLLYGLVQSWRPSPSLPEIRDVVPGRHDDMDIVLDEAGQRGLALQIGDHSHPQLILRVRLERSDGRGVRPRLHAVVANLGLWFRRNFDVVKRHILLDGTRMLHRGAGPVANDRIARLRGLPIHDDAIGLRALMRQPNAFDLRERHVGLCQKAYEGTQGSDHFFSHPFLLARSFTGSAAAFRPQEQGPRDRAAGLPGPRPGLYRARGSPATVDSNCFRFAPPGPGAGT